MFKENINENNEYNDEQRVKLGPNKKKCGAHQIAYGKTILFSTENFQKVHSRPKFRDHPYIATLV